MFPRFLGEPLDATTVFTKVVYLTIAFIRSALVCPIRKRAVDRIYAQRNDRRCHRFRGAACKLSATNESTGINRKAITADDGSFNIPDLPPGRYAFEVKAQGYKTFVQSHLELNVGTTTEVNARLEVGQIQETVEVSAQESQVAVSTDGRLSDTLQTTQITDLPISVRDVFFLPSLNAGATNIPGANFSHKMTNSPTVTVNGNRYRGNNYVLDGSMNTNTLNEGEPGIVPSLESIEEVQVQTGNFSSEYGRGNGSVVNMRTRSGTNEFHGKAWEYLKNASMNARNYFATQITPQVFNQYGARFGGPIARNKAFFFGSFEGTRNALAQALSYQVSPFPHSNSEIQRPVNISFPLLNEWSIVSVRPSTRLTWASAVG
jgi:hypothetical protein